MFVFLCPTIIVLVRATWLFLCIYVSSEGQNLKCFFFAFTEIKSNTTETCNSVNVRNHAFFVTLSWYGNDVQISIRVLFVYANDWICDIKQQFLLPLMIQRFFYNYSMLFFEKKLELKRKWFQGYHWLFRFLLV